MTLCSNNKHSFETKDYQARNVDRDLSITSERHSRATAPLDIFKALQLTAKLKAKKSAKLTVIYGLNFIYAWAQRIS